MSRAKGLDHTISNDRLLQELQRLLERGRAVEMEIVAHLGEVDARRLYLEQACPSMFHYCVHVLHLAESVAYKRIAVARAARRFPELLAALESGDLHLTAASLLAPHLDPDCAAQWLAAARHKSSQEIRQWIADRKPKADVATSVRRAPVRRSMAAPVQLATTSEPVPIGVARQPEIALSHAAPRVEAPATPAPDHSPASAASMAASDRADRARSRCEPLGSGRYCVRLTIDAAVHEELQELRALLRHQVPDADMAVIVGRAVHALLEQVRKQKIGSGSSPRPAGSGKASRPSSSGAPAKATAKQPSRHIPAAIRRAVWARDEGRCSYESRAGRQCGSREFLEFHHRMPWARCRAHALSNLSLRCRSHNQYEAELAFGSEQMAQFRKRAPAPATEEEADPGRPDASTPAGFESCCGKDKAMKAEPERLGSSMDLPSA